MVFKQGRVIGCEAQGLNMSKPVEVHTMFFRAMTAKGYSTISIADEKEGLMLHVKVTDEMKEIFQIILSGEET